MKRIGLTLFVATLFATTAGAQQSGAQAGAQASSQTNVEASKQGAQASNSGSTAASGAAQAGQNSAALNSGSTFNTTLSAPLDSRKSKQGDPVTARSTEPAKSDGKTVFPKGTKFVGHVTQVSSRAKGDSESAIGVVFDKAILKNGQEVPVNLAIQALGSAQTTAAAAGSDFDTSSNLGGSAAGAGSAGGRGGVLGGATSTVGGAAGTVTNTAANVGGAAGGTVSSATNATGGLAGSSKGAVGGLNSAGQLTSNSQGVFGLNGLNLNSAASSGTQGSLITSAGKNVHLDSGTRMLLVSQAQAAAAGESKAGKAEKPEPKNEPKPRSEKPE
jgi:trimeric autotransporter adhesin